MKVKVPVSDAAICLQLVDVDADLRCFGKQVSLKLLLCKCGLLTGALYVQDGHFFGTCVPFFLNERCIGNMHWITAANN